MITLMISTDDASNTGITGMGESVFEREIAGVALAALGHSAADECGQ